jgi:hypothetical protein
MPLPGAVEGLTTDIMHVDLMWLGGDVKQVVQVLIVDLGVTGVRHPSVARGET